jgi:hypothetical protein
MNALVSLERIGGGRDACWVAEITGFLPGGGLARQMVHGNVDYSLANSKGTRGVYVYYIMRPQRVYEIKRPISWARSSRVFVYVDSDGTQQSWTMKDVIEWLSGNWVRTS